MRKLGLLVLLMILLKPVLGLAQEGADIGALLAAPDRYAGQVVSAQGEVLGDVLWRGEYAWVNVGDVSGAIGVWVAAAQVQAISHVGRHGVTGDWVQVTGRFGAWTDLGGDLAIKADQLTVLRHGHDNPRQVQTWRLVLALGLAVLAGALAWVWRRRRA